MSNPQIMGKSIDATQATQCYPVTTNSDMGVTKSFDGTDLDQTATAYPCGLIAKSVFTDKYTLSTVSFQDANYDAATDDVSFDESNIAWKSDRKKFQNQAGNWESIQWLDMTNRKIHLPP